MEEIDNENSFEKTSLTPNTLFTTAYSPSFLNGVVSFTASSPEKNITLIPYYAWDNRDAGEMKVWIDYTE